MEQNHRRRIVFFAFAAQPLFVFSFWSGTWDDGAITMAFARTFAHTGIIEATPGSGILEGYSTTLWMLVLSALAKAASSSAALMTAAKILSCLLNMLNIVLVRSVVRSWGKPVLADLTAGVFGLLELTIYESVNAMEGPLMLTLMLLMVLFLPRARNRHSGIFLISSCLFILARFEAFLLLIPLLLLVQSWKRRITAAAAWLATLVASEIVRHRYFGEWLPNTIIAKRHFPYSMQTRGQEIIRHLLPAVTLSRAFVMLFIVLLFACILRWRVIFHRLAHEPALWLRLRQSFLGSPDLTIAAVIAASGLLLDFAVGQNWGPPDRELYTTTPFLVYILLRITFRVANTWQTRRAVCALLLVLVAYRAVKTAQRLHSPFAPLYMPLITEKTIASLVPPVERIRHAAGLQDLTFAAPDVGGVMLEGDHLRVMDLGLLCDHTMAHDGYAHAPHYIFDTRQPEVIELHSFWTSLNDVGDAPQLYSQYVVMLIDRKRYFVHRDVFAKFATAAVARSFSAVGRALPEDDADLGVELAYPSYLADADSRINEKFGSYYVFRP
jgi:hypothetical protein